MDCSSFVERSKNLKLKDFQRLAITDICSGKDVFVCAPTGSGKSLCYSLLPDAFDFVLKRDGNPTVLRPTVIVISPLVALIKDQVLKAESMGISACGLTEDTSYTVANDAKLGQFRLVFVSPEGIMGSHNDLIASEIYQHNLVAVAVDEAHCITEW